MPELIYSDVTRLTGSSEQVALDIELEANKNRAYISSIERFDSLDFGAVSVTTSATVLRVGASNKSNRRGIFIQNLGTRAIFVGTSSSVTISNGWKIEAGSGFFFATSEAVTWYGICSTGSCSTRILEGS